MLRVCRLAAALRLVQGGTHFRHHRMKKSITAYLTQHEGLETVLKDDCNVVFLWAKAPGTNSIKVEIRIVEVRHEKKSWSILKKPLRFAFRN
jgi:hypothetical protein